MKFLLLFIGFIFILPIPTHADILPLNSHYVDRCVKFVNLDKFPEIKLLIEVSGPSSETKDGKVIENNICLDKGYKFNSFKISWMPTNNPPTVEEYSTIDGILDPFGGSVNNFNPLIKETIEYSIAGFENGELKVYISKKIEEYNNGKSNKVTTFENPLKSKTVVVSKPTTTNETKIVNNNEINPPKDETSADQEIPTQPEKRGFWKSISCFFRSIFGKSCD